MGKIIRNLAIFLVFAPSAAMFVEPFFAEVFDLVGPNTKEWAAPTVSALAKLVTNNTFRTASLMLITFGLGIWVHHLAVKFDAWHNQNDVYYDLDTDLKSDMAGLRNMLTNARKAIGGHGEMLPIQDIEFLSRIVVAVELSLQKLGFITPGLSYEIDPLGFLDRNAEYFQRVWPLFASGHMAEAKQTAVEYVLTLNPDLMRPDGVEAVEKLRR